MGNAPQNEFIQVHSILFPGLGFFFWLWIGHKLYQKSLQMYQKMYVPYKRLNIGVHNRSKALTYAQMIPKMCFYLPSGKLA